MFPCSFTHSFFACGTYSTSFIVSKSLSPVRNSAPSLLATVYPIASGMERFRRVVFNVIASCTSVIVMVTRSGS